MDLHADAREIIATRVSRGLARLACQRQGNRLIFRTRAVEQRLPRRFVGHGARQDDVAAAILCLKPGGQVGIAVKMAALCNRWPVTVAAEKDIRMDDHKD